MLTVRDEALTHPQPFPLSQYRRVLVLAAHPDDEVYGCGGLLALAHEAGADTMVLVLTDGAAGGEGEDIVTQRRTETQAAADLLGYRLEFAGLRDRSLNVEPGLINALQETCSRYRPDLVLTPCLNDPHPDHQALSLASVQVIGSLPHRADLAFYETNGTLTQVTHVLDISKVAVRKRTAMHCFVSQEMTLPYARRIEARDCFRAFTLGKADAAEAYYLARLTQSGFNALLPALDPLFRHGHLSACAQPNDAPLVSVIIRTIGDPNLEEAVASVLAQTYRPIEIVVVAAHARRLDEAFPTVSGCPLVRVVTPPLPLARPHAANVGLDAAKGHYLMFLDDDDILLPTHVEGLVDLLRRHPEVKAARAGVQVVGPRGEVMRQYLETLHPQRLLATNLLPIHAVLFDRSLIDVYNCRFDETLPRYEDWDFWLQVSQHTGFATRDEVTGIYRYRDRSSLCRMSTAVEDIDAVSLRRKVYAKWRARLGDEPFDQALAWLASALDEAEQRSDHYHRQLITAQEQLCAARHQIEVAQSQQVTTIQHYEDQLRELQEDYTRLQNMHANYMTEIQHSTSWRITAPIRRIGAFFRSMTR